MGELKFGTHYCSYYIVENPISPLKTYFSEILLLSLCHIICTLVRIAFFSFSVHISVLTVCILLLLRYLVGIVANNGFLTSQASLKVNLQESSNPS